MMRPESRTRGPIGLLLCALILASSVVAPLLERGGFLANAAVESEHDPATCAHPHDHRICTQVGANLSLMSSGYDHRIAHVVVDVGPVAEAPSASELPQLEGPPTRAPPLV